MVDLKITAFRGNRVVGGRINLCEGRYSAGYYALIKHDLRQLKASVVIPDRLKHLEGYSQKVIQGRMLNAARIKEVFTDKNKEFRMAGSEALTGYVRDNPDFAFASDATNWPYNEGHFVIKDGEILPLPPASHFVTGKHYMLKVTDGRISFEVVDTDNEGSCASVQQGIFVAPMVIGGRAIRLLDEIPGTGVVSIANFRGHIGQIVLESAYSEMNTKKRVDVHTLLVRYLRKPKIYRQILDDIVNGRSVSFGEQGEITFQLNRYNHTFWIETETGEIYCFKTYPILDSNVKGEIHGVTFDECPDLLFGIAVQYGFRIKQAFLGTNGKDVMIIINENGQPTPVKNVIGDNGEAIDLGDYFKRPLSSFIAFNYMRD